MSTLLSMQDIHKTFFGVTVLKNVNFELSAGEVHILPRRKRAGKSTLIKILSGAYRLDSGDILIEGQKKIDPASYDPKKANEYGIVTIYQNFHPRSAPERGRKHFSVRFCCSTLPPLPGKTCLLERRMFWRTFNLPWT